MIENGDRLDSWKAIAEYLGRDRTTVMRWARTAALPVRRVQGGRSVFAFKSDLDRWLAGATPPPPDIAAAAEEAPPDTLIPATPVPRAPRRRRAAAVALGAAAAALLLWAMRDHPVIATVGLVGHEIVASDAMGAVLWRHRLPAVDGGIVPARLLVADIDDDGQPEALAALHFMKWGGHGSAVLMAFDGRGRVRWERSLSDRYRFGEEEYSPPWFPEDILVYQSGGSTRIAVAQHHHTWWPGVVVSYDADGNITDRFVNAGWIRSLNLSADGRYLLAAGINNSFGGAALAVLDPASPRGTSPSEGGPLPACSNCPSGRPVAYLVAPWSALAQPSDTPNALVQIDADGGIQWHAMQRQPENGKVPDVIIGLSPRLEFVRWGVNNYFAELQGAAAPTPVVREWTPARGWRDVTLE